MLEPKEPGVGEAPTIAMERGRSKRSIGFSSVIGRLLALVGLEAGLDALLVEELLHALGAAVFGIAVHCLVELRIQVVFILLPRQLTATLEADLCGAHDDRVLLGELLCEGGRLCAQLVEWH